VCSKPLGTQFSFIFSILEKYEKKSYTNPSPIGEGMGKEKEVLTSNINLQPIITN